MSSRDDYPYPEDEFDALGSGRSPQGVHRAPLPRWRQLLPFLIVLVLAPTLAFVAVRAISGNDDDGGGAGSPTTGTTQSSDAGEEPTDETTDETTDTASETPTEEPGSTEPSTEPTGDLDYSTQIWVLNGSGASGLAAETVTALEDAGWLDANADDYGNAQPSGTTLFYDNADQADEAEAVADQLGIDTLIESSDAADGDIVIVLRSDFSLP